jgi:adenylate cyclase
MNDTTDTPTAAQPTPTEVRAALAQILRSRCFGQAGRASDFLRFVVEQTLAGHGRNLKGYVIATAVFGRPADFDPQNDPLVRVEAGRLRRRLAEYYATDGSEEAVRIALPRGQYTPEWCYFTAPAVQGLAAVALATPAASLAAGERRWRRVSFALGGALALALIVLGWQQRASFIATSMANGESAAFRNDNDRFPLIVTPFDNLSGESELDRSAAALTEEIFLRLDRLDVLVIATPAGWPNADSAQIDDAGYVLTGSIRSAGAHARITVRLVEARSGELLWSAAYNQPRTGGEQSAFHERMALEIAMAAAPYGPIYEAELERTRRASNPQPGLRDCLASYYEYRRRPGAQAHEDARRCFQNVTERRPELANAWAGLALLDIDTYGAYYGNAPQGAELLRQARLAIDAAKNLETHNARAALAEARLQYFVDETAFLASAERAVALDPDGPETLAVIGTLLTLSGHVERGLPLVERASQLMPNPPGHYEIARAAAHLRNGEAEKALDAAQHIGAPNWIAMPLFVTAAAGLAGHHDVAARGLRKLRELHPDLEHSLFERFRKWRYDPVLCDALVRGLRAAGAFPDSFAPPEGG